VHVKEQAGSVTFQPCTAPCHADILAWESSTDEVDGGQIVSIDFSHIFKPLGVWVVLSQHSSAVFVLLYLPNHLARYTFKLKASL
jgi:hypothetical protein